MKKDLRLKLIIMGILTLMFSIGFYIMEKPFWSGFHLAISIVYAILAKRYKILL